ncbi:hypothetical protein [Tsukamurella soli]|uniref:Uncharacterized protein n=1 Tax=Tsukamurella soli TaxID=644556 RepID=A0ABP8J6N9_9ACTN
MPEIPDLVVTVYLPEIGIGAESDLLAVAPLGRWVGVHLLVATHAVPAASGGRQDEEREMVSGLFAQMEIRVALRCSPAECSMLMGTGDAADPTLQPGSGFARAVTMDHPVPVHVPDCSGPSPQELLRLITSVRGVEST